MVDGPNPFLDSTIVDDYQAWYEGPGRRAARLEKALLARLVAWLEGGETLLDLGSGTGFFGRFFTQLGLRVVGVDVSLPMLREAARLGSTSSVLGDGRQLPFDDRSFDLVAIIATLSFVAEPETLLCEAVWVSRRGLLIGALNRASPLGRRVRHATSEPWISAHLLTVSKLRRLVSTACAELRPSLLWYTTVWPGLSGAIRIPWGDFIGMAVRWARPSKTEHRQCSTSPLGAGGGPSRDASDSLAADARKPSELLGFLD
jgi:SAM-dependent methyltransferase